MFFFCMAANSSETLPLPFSGATTTCRMGQPSRGTGAGVLIKGLVVCASCCCVLVVCYFSKRDLKKDETPMSRRCRFSVCIFSLYLDNRPLYSTKIDVSYVEPPPAFVDWRGQPRNAWLRSSAPNLRDKNPFAEMKNNKLPWSKIEGKGMEDLLDHCLAHSNLPPQVWSRA